MAQVKTIEDEFKAAGGSAIRSMVSLVILGTLLLLVLNPCRASARPNVILIFMDDMGYNDVGVRTYPDPPGQYPNSGPAPNYPYTDPEIPAPNEAMNLTPAINRLAAEGLQMTRFYTAPICSPSRAMLLSGRSYRRVNITNVFQNNSTDGFNTTEVTLPELLRQSGYATGMIGKWHLGYNAAKHEPFQMMPTRHGFREFFGVQYSNNMSGFHLIRNEQIIEPDLNTEPEQAQLTWRYTEEALDFIERHSGGTQPFFLYLAHSMTHYPCWPSDRQFANADGTTWPKFKGTTYSHYYDVVAETNHSVDRILAKLDELGIDDDTMIIFTSDNGPDLKLSDNPGVNLTNYSVGSAYPLKDAKHTTWEGGVRVPFFVRWPGMIPAGTESSETGTLMDLLPTLVGLAGGTLPTDRTIDGVDLWPHWQNPATTTVNQTYAAFQKNNTLEAVIKGRWKLRDGKLYDLDDIDDQETTDLSGVHPLVVSDLQSEKTAIESSIAAENEPKGVFTSYEVELSALELTVPEGGTASLTASLSANPGKTVTVSVTHFMGDTDLSVASGSSLTFTTGNWSTPQSVTFAAGQDADAAHDGATFRVTTNDITHVREVFVFESDDEAPSPPTDVILGTDFTGRIVSGSTASNINYTLDGIDSPGNLTVTQYSGSGLAGLFNGGNGPSTPGPQNFFAPDLNTDSEGQWSVEIPLTFSSGTSSLTVRSFDIAWGHYTNSGFQQGTAIRDTAFTVQIIGTSSGAIINQTYTTPLSTTGLTNIDFPDATLDDTESWTLRIFTGVGSNSGGTNSALSGFTLYGTVSSGPPPMILQADFTGRTVSGSTASNINYTLDGIQSPGDLTATQISGGGSLTTLFDTANAQGYFAPYLNTDEQTNPGQWQVDVPLAFTVGTSSLTVESLDLAWGHFNNNGNFQNSANLRDTAFTVQIIGSSSGPVVNQTYTTPLSQTGSHTIDFTDEVLGDTETWTLRIFTGIGANNSGTDSALSGFTLYGTAATGGDTFADWIDGFPGAASDTSFGGDPEGDGLPSGIEAFFGTNPGDFSTGITQMAKSGTTFTFRHPEADPPLSDVTGSYEWSPDLDNWHAPGTVGDITVSISPSKNDPDPGTTTVTVDTAGSVTTPAQLYVRAVASQN